MQSLQNQIQKYLISNKVSFIFAALLIIGTISIFIKKKDVADSKSTKRVIIDCDRSKFATAPIEPMRTLKDLNEIQNLHAKNNGIKPYATNEEFLAEVNNLVKENKLVKIKNNKLYRIKKLTHSYPYVTPETDELLDLIATRFKEKLEEKALGNYQFYVTSVLRTEEFQRKLSRVNRNATVNSAHFYGTTVDISYRQYFNTKTRMREENQAVADILKEVMMDLREECRLLVVREKRQPVYHFTVVNCSKNNLGYN